MSFRIHSGRALQAPAELSRRALLLGAVAATCTLSAPSGALARDTAAPTLMLAEVYRRGMPLDDHWVSEKYDGVRGYWDGKQLWTRGGERIVAPAWFTASLPAVPMDGELWAGRGRFAQAVSTVRSQTPNDAAWHELHFMVFDLPAQPGDFTARLAVLRKLLPITDAPWLVPVPQQRATTHESLQALLDKTVRMGGEGLMLHREPRSTVPNATAICSSSSPTTMRMRACWRMFPAAASMRAEWARCWSRRPRASASGSAAASAMPSATSRRPSAAG